MRVFPGVSGIPKDLGVFPKCWGGPRKWGASQGLGWSQRVGGDPRAEGVFKVWGVVPRVYGVSPGIWGKGSLRVWGSPRGGG